MPASQLKRLKASLRDQGLTGPQKSKKQKKQQAAGKTATDRIQRSAALQQIRNSFNPFEVQAVNRRPEKFASVSIKSANHGASGRYKEVLHRPGVSKSAGEEMRRATLLPEMRRRHKVGGLVDRRIGEGDTDMTPEERAVQRFAREKERKAKGKSMFDLEGSDDEHDASVGGALTHGGRRIDDLVADDFEALSSAEDSEADGDLLRRKRRRSDEDDGEPNEEDDEEDEDEKQPERKKSKREVMHEVIAKSKLHKYERQKAKEDDDDLRMELDQGFDEILSLLQGSKPPASKQLEPAAWSADGPVMNPDRQKLLEGLNRDEADKVYDVRLKQLASDTRAKPSERSKTAEEKAKDEAERLRVLEEKRQKRMQGEDDSGDEAIDAATGDAEAYEDEDEDVPDEAAEFGFTVSNPSLKPQKTEQLVLDDEDEFAVDDDLVASSSEVEDVEDVDLSDDESGSDETRAEAGTAPPEDEEDEFVKQILGPQLSGANTATAAQGEKASSGLSYTYPCPRTHNEFLDIVRDVAAEQLTTVIQRIRALYHPSLSASNKESMAGFSCALVDHLKYMGDEKQPLAVAEQIIRHIHSLSRTYPVQIGEQFRRNLAAFHASGQPSAGDLILLTAIGSIYPTSDHFHQVVTPAITVMAKWLGLNAPSPAGAPDVGKLQTGAFLTALCLRYSSLSKRIIPEALRFTQRSLAVLSRTDDGMSVAHLSNLTTMADVWKDKTAFIELFTPFLAPLQSLNAKREHQHLTILLQQARLRRRPLELHHHKKLGIRTSVPKFEENFHPDRHYDPDKDRSDAKQLQKEYKRERKGALRELRKDAHFIAREQLRDKRERDAAHAARERRLIAEINAEEGREANSYAKEKAKRTAKR